MYMISSNLLLLFNINYIKSWIYSNLMKIGFYSNKRKIEKNNCRKHDSNLRLSDHKHDALASTANGNSHKCGQYLVCIFEKSGLYLVCNTDFFLYRPAVSSLNFSTRGSHPLWNHRVLHTINCIQTFKASTIVVL